MSDLTIFDTEELIALLKIDAEDKKWEQALAKCKVTLQREDCPAELYAISGRLYGQLKLFKHAETQYRQFLAFNPARFPERFELGMTLYDQGKLEDAMTIWMDVLSDETNHPPSHFYLGLCEIQRGDLGKARQHFETILQRAPSNNFYYGKAREELTRLEEHAIREQREGAANH